ncbi:MAG: PmoA family protein [Prolixibacteraceae bacterium]
MTKIRLIILSGIITLGFLFSGNAQRVVRLDVNEQQKKIDVLISDKLFTSYIYPESIKKPVLWPVISAGGNELTRSYPLGKKAGERTDHPHHVGIWLNYGDVNGFDFWNNSEAIPEAERSKYGTIIHDTVERANDGEGGAVLSTFSNWVSPFGEVLLRENTIFSFSVFGDTRIIDRESRLTGVADTVLFTDNKEGVLGIRVTRELELPSNEPVTLTDTHGVATTVKVMDNAVANGNYLSSEGIEGENVWGTRGRWMKLSAKINDEQVSLVIIDHPGNAGYPTYWHARAYGLFAANPLGQRVFSNGKEVLNLMLKKDDLLILKYRIVIASEDLSPEQINRLADEYAKT